MLRCFGASGNILTTLTAISRLSSWSRFGGEENSSNVHCKEHWAASYNPASLTQTTQSIWIHLSRGITLRCLRNCHYCMKVTRVLMYKAIRTCVCLYIFAQLLWLSFKHKKDHPPNTFEEDGVLSGLANNSGGLKEVFWIGNNQGVLQKQQAETNIKKMQTGVDT